MCNLDPDIIRAVHKVLCSNPSKAENLIPMDLGFFLGECHEGIVSADAAQNLIDEHVSLALQRTERHHHHMPAYATWASPTHASHASKTINMKEARLILICIRRMIISIEEHLGKVQTAVAGEHGGLLKHASIMDLMHKAGAAVDITAFKKVLEQVGAVQAALLAGKNDVVKEDLQFLRSKIDEVLVATEGKATQ